MKKELGYVKRLECRVTGVRIDKVCEIKEMFFPTITTWRDIVVAMLLLVSIYVSFVGGFINRDISRGEEVLSVVRLEGE